MQFGQYKMDSFGRIERRKVRKPKNIIADGFRIIRVLNDQDNARRFKWHVERLLKQYQINRGNARFRMRIKTRRAVERMREPIAQ